MRYVIWVLLFGFFLLGSCSVPRPTNYSRYGNSEYRSTRFERTQAKWKTENYRRAMLNKCK